MTRAAMTTMGLIALASGCAGDGTAEAEAQAEAQTEAEAEAEAEEKAEARAAAKAAADAEAKVAAEAAEAAAVVAAAKLCDTLSQAIAAEEDLGAVGALGDSARVRAACPSDMEAYVDMRFALTASQRESAQEAREEYQAPSSPSPTLGGLETRCADGDMVACDDLYMESPWGSEAEAFGVSCGGLRADRADGVWCEDVFGSVSSSGAPESPTSEEENYAVMLAVWNNVSEMEKQVICEEVRQGMSAAVSVGRQIADASNGTVTGNEAAAFLRTVC